MIEETLWLERLHEMTQRTLMEETTSPFEIWMKTLIGGMNLIRCLTSSAG